MPETGPARQLVLLRHGRTAWNHAGRIQGQTDVDLDGTGHAQARAVAPAIGALGPTVLWSSDLARAATTASYVARACGLEVRTDARLREYALGSREGWSHADYATRHPEEFARFATGDFDVVPDGESTVAVGERMAVALGDLLAQTPAGGLAVAVSHGAALRVATAALLGVDPDDLRHLGNCGWIRLSLDGGAHPTADGRARLVEEHDAPAV